MRSDVTLAPFLFGHRLVRDGVNGTVFRVRWSANMRFVATKTPEQQSCLMHRTRHLFIRQQTSVINAIRAHLAEFGIVAPVMVLNNCSMWPPTQATNGCLRLHEL